MQRSVLIAVILFTQMSYIGQNLVPNPSFEDIIDPPCFWTQLSMPEDFNEHFNNWFMPTQGSADIFTTLVDVDCYAHCLSEAMNPISASGNQLPHSGEVMIGLMVFGDCEFSQPYREYAGVKLIQELEIGETYYAEMSVSFAEFTGVYSSNLGFYFDSDSIFDETCSFIEGEPQVLYDEIIYESNDWFTISGTFVADESFEYIYIGNFHDWPISQNESNDGFPNIDGMYFFDDILVRKACENSFDTLNICLGEELTLSSEINEFIGWVNAESPEALISTEEVFQVSPSESTTYFGYTVCDTSTIHVLVNPTAGFTLGNDTSLCPGQSLNLNAPSSADSFFWSNGSSSETFEIFEEGLYWIEMQDDCGTYIDSIVVNYLDPISIDLGEDQSLCFGDSILLDAFSPYANYEWQDNSTEPTFLVTSEGSYSVSVEDHCSNDSDEVEINYYPEIIIDLPDDVLLCNSDSLFFNIAISDATFLWQDGSTEQNFLITEEGLYSVEVTQNGCLKSDSVFVEEDTCEIILDMPNVFSPNGDGYNDVFRPFDINAFTEGSMTIYNRWGGQVYTTSSLASGWDGTCEAQQCISGTYFWVIDYLDINGNKLSLSGDLTLLRE